MFAFLFWVVSKIFLHYLISEWLFYCSSVYYAGSESKGITESLQSDCNKDVTRETIQ